MTIDFIKRIGLLIIFTIAQALILNHIHLFNCATPLLYVYFALLLPRDHPHWASMILCFILGIAIDTFNNTPGLAAAPMTLLGFLQPYILNLFIDQQDEENFKPSIATMGWFNYIVYTAILLLIFCIVFFSLEAFNFFNWIQWLMCIGASFLLTFILIIVIDSVRK